MEGTDGTHERETRKRLPITGKRENITELTAVARIKPGTYPEKRLPHEYKELIFQSVIKFKDTLLGLPKTFLTGFDDRLRQFSDTLVNEIFESSKTSIEPEKLVFRHFETLRVPSKYADTFKVFLIKFIEKLLKQPRPMTWLDHLKWIGNLTHENRQGEIRKMSTIHYARWFILNENSIPGLDGAHLVFTSNYDGELAAYLEDFASVDEGPVNLVFGHCIGWPGARPADGFIKYVKEHEYPALIFYANYPLATVGEVRRALDWKNKTQKFIENDLPKLLKRKSGKWEASARKYLSGYLNELAKPTSNSEEVSESTFGVSR
ncbi:hypothetical protein [Nitrospira sp. Ecomares 2.1]